MKINKLLILFIIIGFLLIIAYILNSMPTQVDEKTAASDILPSANPIWTPIPNSSPGQMLVSIGNYNANFSVFIDNATYGNVSNGNPLNLELSDGIHNVTICTVTECETSHVLIDSAITTTIDFEKRLILDLPQGSLNVTIGNYSTGLLVYIDNSSAGEIFPGTPLNQTLRTGPHMVQVCTNTSCFSQSVIITPMNVTTADFESQLINNTAINNTLLANLVVSIGGYDATLPVIVDNLVAGNVSMGVPLTVKVTEGIHNVTVCSGVVCEYSNVTTRFGKATYQDFGDSLTRDAPNQKPGASIINSVITGNDVTVNVMLFNPTATDKTITATISCVYSYLDYESTFTQTDTANGQISQTVDAGGNKTASVELYLSHGANPNVLSQPIISSVKTS
jgi:hypothetical protein